MIKLFLILIISIQLFALEQNTTKEITNLEDDLLFHAQRENGLTIYDAINRAMRMSPKINASYQTVVQNNQKVREAQAGHLPVVNLSGDLGQETRTYKADAQNPSYSSAPITQIYNYKKTDIYVTLTENLWNGGSIENSVDEKDATRKASMYEYRDKIETLVVNVATAYFDVVYGEIALKISKKNMRNYKKILKIVTIKEKNGAATKGDVNFIRANVSNAQTQLVQRQKTLSDAMAQYVYLLQTDKIENLPYEIATDFYNEDLNTTLESAQERNAKLLTQKAYIKSTKFAFLATKGKFQPKIDLSINSESRNEFDAGLGRKEKLNALLSFNYNLYNGGKDEATAIRLLSKMKEQKYIFQDLERSLRFGIKVLHRSVHSLSESLQLTQNEVLAARKVVNSYWIAFQHGTQDLQALQLAQRNLNSAEQSYASYKKDLIINNYKLMRKAGVLLQHIKLPYKHEAKSFKADSIEIYDNYLDLK